MDIGLWVREARTHAKLTMQQLGEALGRTKGNVSSWEANRHAPSFSQLLKIAEVCDYALPSTATAFASERPARYLADEASRLHHLVDDITHDPKLMAEAAAFLEYLKSRRQLGEFSTKTGTHDE